MKLKALSFEDHFDDSFLSFVILVEKFHTKFCQDSI